MTGAEIRRGFIEYFVSKGHTSVKSAPLVPANDATLLFTNAGMVQFKDVFTGQEKRSYSRAASSQKCLRVSGKHNDLETVGRTALHHTFFEMLGNFSFGDYFKREAIEYAWEFVTVRMGLPPEKLWITVFREDDEAAAMWEKNIGLPAGRIMRLGEKDNFWSMGDTGPCGPCSEIHIDRGAHYACPNPNCGPDCDCDRFLEIWNLVFMQFNRDASGKMTPLPNPSIDTGMGLERLASVVQGVETNFDTDLILPVIRNMERLTGSVYGNDPETDVSFRVIGDHIRALAFLIADGVTPSNMGRGYVLRRVLRRALRHGRMLGVTEPFAHRLVDTVAAVMKDTYPEVTEALPVIRGVTLAEERGFSATLENGMKLIGEMIEQAKAKGESVISGAEAFRLYDTYGFPLDLANDIASDAGMRLDMEGYNTHMEQQRQEARKSWKGGAKQVAAVYTQGAPTRFTGYDEEATDTNIAAIIVNGAPVTEAGEGTEAEIMLEATPCYAESGGQVGDTGRIASDRMTARILDVTKPDGERWVHKVKITGGTARVGDKVRAGADHARRAAIRRNHSATHLLHAALRETLGLHVKQAGSLVAPDRLRFDYTHFAAPDSADLEKIERIVNEKIMANLAVATQVRGMDEAVQSGAMALFGEKYGDKVRVVSMGDFSMELCGGTHARATGDIGLFLIVSEGGVAAGVRRIEAVTGEGALEAVMARRGELLAVAEALKSPPVELPEKTRKLAERARDLEKEIKKLKEKLAGGGASGAVEPRARGKVGEITVLAYDLGEEDAEYVRTFVDNARNREKSTVIVAGSRAEGKAVLAAGVTKDITNAIKAGAVIKETAAMVGGGGGGRPDFAQAGGKDPGKLGEALDAVVSIVEKLAKG
ncbi:MAG: alanine--tRNA ligase [Nitrospinae bacterium]|nr:alanine--tRNA ligase [Nitrospinota bacterium]